MDNFNEQLQYENLQKSLSEQLEETLSKGDKMSQVLNGLEIKPNGMNILVKPYLRNPYEKIEVRESGIIVDEGAAKFQNPDSGEEEQQTRGILVGRVIEVGPLATFVKEGDDVYYHIGSVVPLPFFRQGFQIVAETRILSVVNVGLTERIENGSK